MTTYNVPEDFNPRSREGSDRRIHQQGFPKLEFQSTLPRRERRCWITCFLGFVRISIHAPAKGATHCLQLKRKSSTNFNPRSREGSDIETSSLVPGFQQFQSTLPRRERRFHKVFLVVFLDISIHAPAKGATCMEQTKKYCILQFQSTLPRRERRDILQFLII